ncbi:hypothetical protein [Streptomyces jeddahensis]|uniref:Uncharacterized protein n=1 Tax=Streptomyces jeddahensis TaxID=1716141 RepID=A0A177HPU6_9ACTN|nr:hypothetical protein [Streptomyces jeddahensis]OAH12224.1 hypothetical protein STSP_44190 [Streptomyces jeddahensis]
MARGDNQAQKLRIIGLTGALLCAVLSALLWLGADVLGTKECMENGYGLGVEGGGSLMTEQGCELTVPTTMGVVSGVLPTISEPVATAALIAGLGGALPPGICLWLATRRPR